MFREELRSEDLGEPSQVVKLPGSVAHAAPASRGQSAACCGGRLGPPLHSPAAVFLGSCASEWDGFWWSHPALQPALSAVLMAVLGWGWGGMVSTY